MATVVQSTDLQVQSSLTILQELMRGSAAGGLAVRFWDGTTWHPEPDQPAQFTLVLKHPGSLRKMFWPPGALSISRAYLYDDFDIEGDMLAYQSFCEHLEKKVQPAFSFMQKLRLGWRLWNQPKIERPRAGRQTAQFQGQIHSRERDQQAIT